MDLQVNTPDTDDLAGLLASLTAAEAAETGTAQPPVQVVIAPANDDADEASLLAELEGIAAPVAEIAADTELDEDLLADLESTVARAEIYSSQAAGASVADAADVAAVQKPAKKARKPKDPNAAPAAARAPRKALADLDDGVFQLFNSETPGPANKQVTLDARPQQVKVAEKFDNLFLAIDAGKAPSRYVVTAFKLLRKTGAMTSADLNAAYIAEGLGKGTANSQTGQIMHLFATVGIANRSGQALQLRADSTVATKLDAIIGA